MAIINSNLHQVRVTYYLQLGQVRFHTSLRGDEREWTTVKESKRWTSERVRQSEVTGEGEKEVKVKGKEELTDKETAK